MRYLSFALLLTAMTNLVWKSIQLQRLHGAVWSWVAAMITAALLIEWVDFQSNAGAAGRDSRRDTSWIWIARMIVIVPLAALRVDADVVRVTTDFIHRSEFQNAALQELAAIRATELTWLSKAPIRTEGFRVAIARTELIEEVLQSLETSEDLIALSRRLDANHSNLLPTSPVGGYTNIVAMHIRITPRQHAGEWTAHGSDLVRETFWLMLPYALYQLAFGFVRHATSGKGAQGHLFEIPRGA